jgi:ATP phosphoribosyltransferase
VRFPQQPVIALCDLGVGALQLWAAACESVCRDVSALGALPVVRLASDRPNIADAFARSARLPRYRVHSVWGAAEAYPPEDADVVIVPVAEPGALAKHGLAPLLDLMDDSAWLVANALALASKDLRSLIGPVLSAAVTRAKANGLHLPPPVASSRNPAPEPVRETLRLAIPDGHQQPHVFKALAGADLAFEGYGEKESVRRPRSGIAGLDVKVIRPHDMPQLVATGEFDLAITGRDVLREHLYAFPSSPAEEVVDLHRSQYNMCAVVDADLPVENIAEATDYWRGRGIPALRIAAELPTTADHYARSRHFWRYQVIPIAGASEGFVPEDAELLIEGTETGRTLKENNLRSIDLIYRSTTCVIANRDRRLEGRRAELFGSLIEAFQRSGEAAAAAV